MRDPRMIYCRPELFCDIKTLRGWSVGLKDRQVVKFIACEKMFLRRLLPDDFRQIETLGGAGSIYAEGIV